MRATVRVAGGETAAALADLDDLLAIGDPLANGLDAGAMLPVFAWLALDLDRSRRAKAVFEPHGSPRWTRVARTILAADATTAADLLADIGYRPAEAYACLRAGGDYLQRALTFYRSVGARRYLRKAESRVAASA